MNCSCKNCTSFETEFNKKEEKIQELSFDESGMIGSLSNSRPSFTFTASSNSGFYFNNNGIVIITSKNDQKE